MARIESLNSFEKFVQRNIEIAAYFVQGNDRYISFSVAQIIQMILSNVNFCLGLISDQGGTLQHIFPKSFINYSNKAIENSWAINNYDKRQYSLCRSELHKIFFEDILMYKKDPYGLVISEENLKKIVN